MTVLGRSTRVWILSLIAAAIGAAAGAVPVVIIDPQTFNPFDHGSLSKLAAVVIVSMALAVAMYLKEHPLPDEDDDTIRMPRDGR
jgi:hypothetical protein